MYPNAPKTGPNGAKQVWKRPKTSKNFRELETAKKLKNVKTAN